MQDVTFDPKFRLDLAVSAKPRNGREAMAGIRVEPAAGRMIATNGHIMAVVPLTRVDPESAPHDPVGVPAAAFKAARSNPVPNKWGVGRLNLNGSVSVAAKGGTMTVEPVEGEFPNVDALPVPEDGCRVVRLNAGHLLRLAQALGNEDVQIEIPADPAGALRVRPLRPLHTGGVEDAGYGLCAVIAP